MTTTNANPTLQQAIAACISYSQACQTADADAQAQAAAAAISAAAALASANSASGSVTTIQQAIATVQNALSQVLNNATVVQQLVASIQSYTQVATNQATLAVASANSASASATTSTGAATTATGAAATATSAAATATTEAGIATSAAATASAAAAALASAVLLQGAWNPSTNSPALASGVGTKGYFYVCSTSGSTTLDGISSWNASDWALFDGTAWHKIDGVTLEVTSVAGRTGAVTLTSSDLTDATTAGKALLTAASATAQKTALAIAVADVSGAAPLASPAFTGTPVAPTAALSTNTTQVATTAFVIANSVSTASPAFTGTPTAPTAAVDTNTTQLATTAFVLGQAASATPLATGVAAVGTSTRFARADHVHPSVWAQIAQTVISGSPSTVAFTSIPLTYNELLIEWSGLGGSATSNAYLDVSANNGTTYSGTNAVVSALTSGGSAGGAADFVGYSLNNGLVTSCYSASPPSSPGLAGATVNSPILTAHTGGCNALRLRTSTGTFASGTVTIYGRA